MAQTTINPVKAIDAARKYAAKVATVSSLLTVFPVPVFFFLIAATLHAHRTSGLDGYGFYLPPQTVRVLARVYLLLSVISLVAGLIWTYNRRAKASSIEHVAERIDTALGAHQEIVTFAEAVFLSHRNYYATSSSLLPLLRDRVAHYLESLDLQKIFAVDGRRILFRSVLTGASVLTLTLLTLFVSSRLLRPPYAEQITALRELASELAKSSASDESKQLARNLVALADTLNNPSLSTAEKLRRIDTVRREIEELEHQSAVQQATSKRSLGANVPVGMRGAGQGKGSGGQAASGSGQSGQGNEKEENAAGEATAKGAGKGSLNEVERKLSQIERQLRHQMSNEGKLNSSQLASNRPEKQREPGPGTGEKPTREAVDLSRPGSEPVHSGERSGGAGPQQQQNSGSKSPKTGAGDTHLGEIPAPVKYERFYAPGEHGERVAIKDARYVVVSIPPAPSAAGGGEIVAGGPAAKAKTPLANLPMPMQGINASVSERQLIPPKYWDLLQ